MKKTLIPLAVLFVAIAAWFSLRQPRPNAPAPVRLQADTMQPLTTQQQLGLVRMLCKGQLKVDDNQAASCSTCPPQSDFAGEQGADSGWTADGILQGHFTAAGVDQALLHAAGCESHANNMGGDYLLQRSAAGWQLVRYIQGSPVNDGCETLRWQGGRDAVICKTPDMHQGIASESLQLLSFDAAAPAAQGDFEHSTFLMTTDQTGNCGFEPGGPGSIVQFGGIDSFDLLPTGPDGRQDLAVIANLARARATASASGTCPQAEKKNYRLTFKNQGDHFEAAEGYESLAALAADDCCELVVGRQVRPGQY